MRFKYVIPVFLILLQISSAQRKDNTKGLLKIDIADKYENAPIRGAHIVIHPHNNSFGRKPDIVLKFNQSDKFNIPLLPGHYKVTISAPAFISTSKEILIEPGKITTYSPRLRINRVHLEEQILAAAGFCSTRSYL